jgi:hypothetical protein
MSQPERNPGDYKKTHEVNANESKELLSLILYTCVVALLFPLFIGVPIVITYLRQGPKYALGFALLATGIVFIDFSEISCFLLSLVVIGPLCLAYLLSQQKSFTVVFFGALATVHAGIFLIIGTSCLMQKITPIAYWEQKDTQLHQYLADLKNNPQTSVLQKILPVEEYDDLERKITSEFVSNCGIFIILYLWLCILLSLKVLKKIPHKETVVSEHYFKSWKLPEGFVWPTIGFGALVIFGNNLIALIGVNGLRILLTLYLIQGFSIINYLFDHFKVTGFVRTSGYCCLTLTFLLHSVITLGFTDLWFDFRSRLKQT